MDDIFLLKLLIAIFVLDRSKFKVVLHGQYSCFKFKKTSKYLTLKKKSAATRTVLQ